MIIETKKVGKVFKNNVVLDDVDTRFEEGKIYGLSGRNGTGKSVFLKILCGLYTPTSGQVFYDGEVINMKKNFPKDVSALIEKPSFFPNLTGLENLKLLSNIRKKINDEDILKALKIVNLTDYNKKYSKYSLGMKQKLGIAQAIMEYPNVIILDEPFNGIEEITVSKIKKYLLDLKKMNKIIIISSHIKEDLTELCDVIYYFDNGKVKEDFNDKKN